MPSLDEIARFQTALSDDDVAWLQALARDWQILADLSFSDLVLWVPDAESKGFWAAAQIRPTTGPTTLLEDVAGTFVPSERGELLEQAIRSGRAVVDTEDELRIELIPVRPDNSTIAVVARRSAQSILRATSALEGAYEAAASALMAMIQRGQFPLATAHSDTADSLRVGDGFVRTDRSGTVVYASPNALSAYRRLGLKGDLSGADLGDVTTALVDRRPTDRGPRGLFSADDGGETSLENMSASLMARVIPLHGPQGRDGSLVLLRDVTELRLRERELVSKEATIREIHHRVKNNLQTVAALLRLQARRSDLPEARAALEDAERRVASIALVHETLSQSFGDFVDFDGVVDGLLRTVIDFETVAPNSHITASRIGDFGTLPGDAATPLAMVVTELLQNAVHHAFGEDATRGKVTVAVNRIRDRLRLRVSDDGRGLPDDFDPAHSLGLSIVTTLVESELGGTLSFDSTRRGTTVTVALQLS